MKGSVRLPIFIDDARKYVNTTQLRAKYLGASYEAEYCQWQTLHGLGSLMETASLIITPNAFLEGKLIASYPPDPIGDFDVVRATTATRVNSAGLVELVPYNLLSYSEQFDNAYWLKFGSITANANATTSPNGIASADSLIPQAVNGTFAVAQPYTKSTEPTSYTFSGYAKSFGYDFLILRIDQGDGNGVKVAFNINTGIISTAGATNGSGWVFGSADIVDAQNGWYRFSISFTTGSNTYLRPIVYISNATGDGFSPPSYTANGTSGTYIWGAQLNEGTLKDYQKTETRLNIPRLDYSNGTCPSILVEPQRTNRVVYSSSFDNAAWVKFNANITANSVISPSGIQDADTMTITSSTSRIFQTLALGAGTFTASIYVKSLSGTPTIQFRMVVDGNDITESIPTTTDWVRHDFTFTASSSVSYFVIRGESGTGSVAIWGAQLEAGTYPTSYIPTTSASVTRNADVVSKTGISSLIGQTEGTLFLDFVLKNPLSATNRIISITEPSWTDGSIRLDIDYNKFTADFVNGGSNIGNIGYFTTVQPNTRYKVAIAYKVNDCQMYVNGVDAGSDTTTGAMPTCSELYLNALGGGFNAPYEASNINASALWKTRLTNTQLQTLTSI